MLPGVPNQPKAHETHIRSFLQSSLKGVCVCEMLLPWGRRNESPRLHFALEYAALLMNEGSFVEVGLLRKGQGGEGPRADVERKMAKNEQLR